MKPHRQRGAHKREVVRHKCLRLHLSVAPPLCLSWIHNTFSLSMLILCSSLFPLHPPIHLFHPSPTSPFSFYIFIFVLSSFISPLVLSLSTPHLLAGWLAGGVWVGVCVCLSVRARERAGECVWHSTGIPHNLISSPVSAGKSSHTLSLYTAECFHWNANQPAVLIKPRTNTQEEVQR